MLSKKLVSLSCLSILATSPFAYADCLLGYCSTGCMSVPCGWYLEAGVGSSHISDENWPGKTSTSGIGGQAAVGYKFMPYLGLELDGFRYQNTSVNVDNIKLGTVKNFAGALAFRGILPFASSGFELFAKVGVARVYANFDIKQKRKALANSLGISESSHSKTGNYYGAGMQYFLMPEFAIFAQWSRANGSDSTGNMELLSAGVFFIFD